MIDVTLAPGFTAEQTYVLSTLLGRFLRVPFRVAEARSDGPRVVFRNGNKELALPQHLFSGPDRMLARPDSLPRGPLPRLRVAAEQLPPDRFCGEELPVLCGSPSGDAGGWIEREEHRVTLRVDVLGGAFLQLTRIEEIVEAERDEFDRFPASASLAFREAFLTRPLVNEYAELLFLAMQELWPRLPRAQRSFQVRATHDVDRPFTFRHLPLDQRIRRLGLRTALREIEEGNRRTDSLKRLWHRGLGVVGLPHSDPLDTFGWIFDTNEEAGIATTFYFLAGGEAPLDGDYELESRCMGALLQSVVERGHEVGLHASFDAYRDRSRLHAEAQRLREILEARRGAPAIIGGRHHYLRCEVPTTWDLWNEAGLAHDATLGFAAHAGFRCGSCYEFPLFNPVTRTALDVEERPLIVMDGTLSEPDHMNLTREESEPVVRELKDRVRMYSGNFEICWHNDYLARGPEEREFYRWVLAA